MKGPGTLPLSELGAALLGHGALTCNGEVETDGEGAVTVRFTVPWQQAPADVHELYEALTRTAGAAQVRAFAARYGIDPAALEALLPQVRLGGWATGVGPQGDVRYRTTDPESMLGILRRCVNGPTAALDPFKTLGDVYDILREHYGDV